MSWRWQQRGRGKGKKPLPAREPGFNELSGPSGGSEPDAMIELRLDTLTVRVLDGF